MNVRAFELQKGDELADGRVVKKIDDHITRITIHYTDGMSESVSYCQIIELKPKEVMP